MKSIFWLSLLCLCRLWTQKWLQLPELSWWMLNDKSWDYKRKWNSIGNNFPSYFISLLMFWEKWKVFSPHKSVLTLEWNYLLFTQLNVFITISLARSLRLVAVFPYWEIFYLWILFIFDSSAHSYVDLLELKLTNFSRYSIAQCNFQRCC